MAIPILLMRKLRLRKIKNLLKAHIKKMPVNCVYRTIYAPDYCITIVIPF